MYTYFDIETGPADDADQFVPRFEAPGNYKDADKIKAHLAEQELKWRESLALSAITGKVLVIGWLEDGKASYFDGDEKNILTSFWASINARLNRSQPVIGFNIHSFDLPFLVRRSWKLGVPVYHDLRDKRYWHSSLIDLKNEWESMDYSRHSVSLDLVARWLGVGKKNGDGADFAQLYKTDPAAALNYLANDLRLTEEVGKKMGYKSIRKE